MTVSRRSFIQSAGFSLVGLSLKSEPPIAADPSSTTLSSRATCCATAPLFLRPSRIEKVSVVIVGGGIAGLSAAWRLHKRGFHDFVLLEMNDQAGGNSRWGENEITAYPWAAHYVPVPGARRSTFASSSKIWAC